MVPVAKAPRTIITTASMWSSPAILAARREMQNWRLLAMEPMAMRRADPLVTTPYLTTQGGHLHATLHRVANTPTIDNLEPEQVYGFIRTTLGQFVSIKGLEVEVDPVRQLLMTQVEPHLSGGKVPARSLSDGTLRFLAMSVLREEPVFDGLVCIEEPENGIPPNKMEVLVKLLKEMTVDVTSEPDEYNPMRQVIIATHSPTLVQLLSEEDLLIAIQSTTRGASGKPINVIACWPLSGTWRSGENGDWLNLVSILAFLTPPSNAQIKWEWESQKKAA